MNYIGGSGMKGDAWIRATPEFGPHYYTLDGRARIHGSKKSLTP